MSGKASVPSEPYPYLRIAEDLRTRIHGGEWKAGARLPTVEDLARDYAHSRATVNKALQHLGQQGLLSIRRGRGIHVLATEDTQQIGLLLGKSLIAPRQGPFAAVLAQEAQACFRERGIDYRLYVEDPALLPEGIPCEELRSDLAQGRLSGLITAQCDAPKTLHISELWRRRPLPLVDIGGQSMSTGGHSFVQHRMVHDTERIYSLAMQEASARHRTNMAILSFGPLVHTTLEATARRYGINIRPDRIYYCQQEMTQEESGYLGMLSLWQGRTLPNSVLILDDVMAKGAAQAMLKLGLAIPHELLPIALTNSKAEMFFPIPLVQLEQDMQACIREATNLVCALIANPQHPPQTLTIPLHLRLENGMVARESTEDPATS